MTTQKLEVSLVEKLKELNTRKNDQDDRWEIGPN